MDVSFLFCVSCVKWNVVITKAILTNVMESYLILCIEVSTRLHIVVPRRYDSKMLKSALNPIQSLKSEHLDWQRVVHVDGLMENNTFLIFERNVLFHKDYMVSTLKILFGKCNSLEICHPWVWSKHANLWYIQNYNNTVAQQQIELYF